ncbi:MAG: metallophosphoesterase [Methanomassiliicoccales archaeon]|jgi:putative phosphoesterase
MRFLVISDIHGRDRVIDWVNRIANELRMDGMIVLGDITRFGPPEWAERFFENMVVPVFAIPGNCDPPGVIEVIERKAISLHKKKLRIGDHTFVGMGGSTPTLFNTPYELSEEEMEQSLRPLMEKEVILVTHTPPLGANDMAFSGRRGGSLAIRKIVNEFSPKAVLSGHIHEAPGIVMEGSTIFLNPGAAKDARAAIVDLNEEIEARLLEKLVEY